jgi:MFS family permease
MYCWGNLLSYMPPELKYWAGAAAATGVPDAQFVLAYTIMAQTIGMPIGPYLYPILGARKTALLGSVLMGSGVILASYATSLATFVPFFCVMFGLGVGIAYQMPILTGTKWFPKSKGGVSGAVIFGMGASAFFFNNCLARSSIASRRSFFIPVLASILRAICLAILFAEISLKLNPTENLL